MAKNKKVKKDKPIPKELYHYTSLYHLDTILEEGYLKLTPSNLREPKNPRIENHKLVSDSDNIKPVVWLTSTRYSDKTADTTGLSGSVVDKTEVCFVINNVSNCKHWKTWAFDLNIELGWFKLITKGYDYKDWYISEKIIPIKDTTIIFKDTIPEETINHYRDRLTALGIAITKWNEKPKEN